MGALGGALVMKFVPAGVPAIVMFLLVVLASLLMGVLFSLLLGVAAINFNADQTLVGTLEEFHEIRNEILNLTGLC